MKPKSNGAATHPSAALQPMSAAEETELAQELLRIRNDQELDHFLPLLIPVIKAAAPMLMQAAGPLLKNLVGGLFGGGSRRSRPQNEQEYFLGGIVKGLLGGEMEQEQEQDHEQEQEQEQFLGGIFKGLLGGEMEQEQEQLLGGLIGKIFGGREMEQNYVQEQFLGGILKGIMGGEMEYEGAGPSPRLRRARRFVRLATHASRRAAHHIMRLIHSGQRPTLHIVRRIVAGAIIATARRLFGHRHHPHHAPPMQFQPPSPQGPPEPSPPSPPPGANGAHPPQGETLLEMMVANARPIAMT